MNKRKKWFIALKRNRFFLLYVYTDKSAITQDCLDKLTPYINEVISLEIPKKNAYDYSDVKMELDEYFCDLYSSNF